jgi:protease I
MQGKTIAILAADGVEQVELEQPRQAVQAAGAVTELLSIKPGEIQAVNSDIHPSVTFTVDRLVGEASAGDYDALILPGGAVNPDNLRQHEAAVGFVPDFVNSGKPVGVICHGPWTFVEAGVVRGRTLTSYPSVRTDIRNAGGNVVDQEVVTDQNITSSRWPDDLPAFCARIVEQFARRHYLQELKRGMAGSGSASSTWAPLRTGAFRTLWIAALVSNVGECMQTVKEWPRLP